MRERLADLEAAAHEVECYQNLIERLTSVHKECGEPIDWVALRDSQPPPREVPESEEIRAKRALASYKPGFLDKLFRTTERKTQSLQRAVDEGRQRDSEALKRVEMEYSAAVALWKDQVELAEQVLKLDPEALREAVREFNPVKELTELGSSVDLKFLAGGVIDVTVYVKEEEVLPREIKVLLKSGKLSTKKLPAGQFWELYQDYVASAVLRAAREMSAVVPAKTIYVTAVANLLNKQSGHLEEQPILSIKVPRGSLDRINFDAIDPSDAMKNFVHEMDFRRTKGLSAVKRLSV